jgi:hypothetical protein
MKLRLGRRIGTVSAPYGSSKLTEDPLLEQLSLKMTSIPDGRLTNRIVVRCRHCGAVNSAPVGADPLTCSKTADLTGAYYRIS